VTYLNNRARGQWKAHGRYLARESATFDNDAKAVGFSRESNAIDIAAQPESWQAAGDERFWKLIVSPEFGDRVDLSRLTRGLIERMEDDLGTALKWTAVAHHNTEHPHVHVVVRGRKDDGDALRLRRQYVQSGIREIAGDLCTRQLGYRTELDAAGAERREITEARFTSLDRRLMRDMQETSPAPETQSFAVTRNPAQAGLTEAAHVHTKHEAARLAVLGRMGPAELAGPNTWHLRCDFAQILRQCSELLTGRGRSRRTEPSCPMSACPSKCSIRRR
jgi:hypothetical protein